MGLYRKLDDVEKGSITSKRNYAVPGKPFTDKEVKALIKEAENGKFISVTESRKLFQEWRKKHYKL